MKNICLIYPTSYDVELGVFPPLGLCYIAAALEEKGYQVIIIDRDIIRRKGDNPDHALKKTLDEHKPELVGITATSPLILDANHSAKVCKKVLPNLKVAIGGIHPTVLPHETLESCPEIDIVIRGEGETTMSEIAEGRSLKDIAGICYRDNGKICSRSNRELIRDLDTLPLPARHLCDMEFYLRPTVRTIRGVLLRATHIYTARGCLFRCNFCAGQAIFGHKVRFRSPKLVADEIEHLVSSYGIDGLRIDEDMFLANKKRAIKICNELIKRGLHKKIVWSAQTSVRVVTKEMLEMMKKAGCIQVEYGFESGSQRKLDIMRKCTTVEENYRAAKLTKEVGLRIMANILVNIPGETKEDFIKDIEFVKETKPDYVALNKFMPFAGSEMSEDIKKEGMLPCDWGTVHGNAEQNKEINFTEMSNEEFWELYNNFTKQFIMPRGLVSSIKFLFFKNIFTTMKRFMRNPGPSLDHLLFVLIKRAWHNLLRR